MYGLAVGRLGLSRRDFKRMTPREFHSALEVKREEARAQWEMARYQAWLIVAPYGGDKYPDTPEKFFPFDWDRQGKTLPPKQSVDEMKRVLMGLVNRTKKKPLPQRPPKRHARK